MINSSKIKALLLIGSILSLASCASMDKEHHHHSLNVETKPVSGAACTVSNEHGTWTVPTTPGSVTVQGVHGDLSVSCHKGKYHGTHTVTASTGDYPSSVTVLMHKHKKHKHNHKMHKAEMNKK